MINKTFEILVYSLFLRFLKDALHFRNEEFYNRNKSNSTLKICMQSPPWKSVKYLLNQNSRKQFWAHFNFWFCKNQSKFYTLPWWTLYSILHWLIVIYRSALFYWNGLVLLQAMRQNCSPLCSQSKWQICMKFLKKYKNIVYSSKY